MIWRSGSVGVVCRMRIGGSVLSSPDPISPENWYAPHIKTDASGLLEVSLLVRFAKKSSCEIQGAPGLCARWRNHHLAHSPGAPCISHEDFLAKRTNNDTSSNPDASVFMCGAYQFSGDIGSGLLKTLPPILILQTTPTEPLRQIITLVSNELNQPSPGHQTVLDRLLDLLIVYALRASLEQSPAPPAWFRAATDSRLGAALQVIHSQPENT